MGFRRRRDRSVNDPRRSRDWASGATGALEAPGTAPGLVPAWSATRPSSRTAMRHCSNSRSDATVIVVGLH
jgi:hypothetical protein